MGLHKQPRRWAVEQARSGAAPYTEHSITPDEARTGLLAYIMTKGYALEEIVGYDPQKDRWQVMARRSSDAKLCEMNIPGAQIATVVKMTRTLLSTEKPLIRPSEFFKGK